MGERRPRIIEGIYSLFPRGKGRVVIFFHPVRRVHRSFLLPHLLPLLLFSSPLLSSHPISSLLFLSLVNQSVPFQKKGSIRFVSFASLFRFLPFLLPSSLAALSLPQTRVHRSSAQLRLSAFLPPPFLFHFDLFILFLFIIRLQTYFLFLFWLPCVKDPSFLFFFLPLLVLTPPACILCISFPPRPSHPFFLSFCPPCFLHTF